MIMPKIVERSPNQKTHRTVSFPPFVRSQSFENQPHIAVSVVIPALNEAQNLPHVLPYIPDWVHEVILVPGHSTDDTVSVAQSLWPTIRVVEQHGRGKGAALCSGFAAATGNIIIMIDADGSMAPSEMHLYVGALLAGADFVKGTRFMQGGGTDDMEFYRKFGNWCFTYVSNLLFGGKYSDLCYGYNAFWVDVLPQLHLDGDGFEIETMMNVRALCAGLKVLEVPSFEAARIYGSSNLRTLPDGWRILKTLVNEWLVRNKPSTGKNADRPAFSVDAPAQARASEDQAVPLAEREYGM